MTSISRPRDDRSALRRPASHYLLVVAAGAAWVATIRWARTMGNGPGTMGLGWAEFLGVWAVMMAAMMLPTVWHETAEQPAAGQHEPVTRVIVFAVGYLSVWAVAGIAAFGLATGGGRLATHNPGVATGAAAVLFAVCGLYQFSPPKSRALAHCRLKAAASNSTPDGGAAGALLRGVGHGGWCLGSSWGLTALLIAFGVMNVIAMVVLLLAIYAERTRLLGGEFSRLMGLASLVLVPLVLLDPYLAPGLHQAATSMGM